MTIMGVGEAQARGAEGGGVRRGVQHLRFGVGDAELVADLIERGLFLQRGVQPGGGAGGDVLGQFGLAADDHGRVVVGAAEQVQPLAGVLRCKVAQHAQHRRFAVDVGHHGKVYDAGILRRRHGVAAESVTLDAVSLMEGRGQSCSS